MRVGYFIITLVFLNTLPSCSCNEGKKQTEVKRITRKEMAEAKKTFAKINKTLIDEDRTLIESYIKRYKLDGMRESGTGLYYLVWGNGEGDSIKYGNVVEYNYKLSLLDGKLCYKSEPNNPKTFRVGMGGVESGLEQAVLLMLKGQKGKYILPPHLAHGLIGDADKIPARAIIVYDIEMLNVYR